MRTKTTEQELMDMPKQLAATTTALQSIAKSLATLVERMPEPSSTVVNDTLAADCPPPNKDQKRWFCYNTTWGGRPLTIGARCSECKFRDDAHNSWHPRKCRGFERGMPQK